MNRRLNLPSDAPQQPDVGEETASAPRSPRGGRTPTLVERGGKYALNVVQNRMGWVPKPSWCTYLVSFRCNATCGMCDSWRLPKGREMTVEEVRTVFGKLGALDVVRLSGGEPFLRTDLLQIAESVVGASRPLVLHVTTNGSYPERVERFAAEVARHQRTQIMVSLDGMPAKHDANRGRQATFDRASDTVRRLVALRLPRLGVSINHTIIDEQSLADAKPLREQMAALGVDVQVVLAYEDSAMYGAERHGGRAESLIIAGGYPLHPAIPREQAVQLVREESLRVKELRNPWLRRAKRYYFQGLLKRLEGSSAPRKQPHCVALRSHIRLLPDGSVPVCQFNSERVGNLVDDSLERLWHREPSTLRSRAWVDRCAGCWAECEVMPNALYSGELAAATGRLV